MRHLSEIYSKPSEVPLWNGFTTKEQTSPVVNSAKKESKQWLISLLKFSKLLPHGRLSSISMGMVTWMIQCFRVVTVRDSKS